MYEVKARDFEYYKNNEICITQNTLNVLKQSEKFGIVSKFAIVLLYDNWNYSVDIKSLQEMKSKLWISTNNNYDKEKYNKSVDKRGRS